MKKILTLASTAVLAALMLFTAMPQKTYAQELSITPGVDITSRFIYRGLDLGSSPQVQPSIALNYGDFNFTLWGSHPLALTPDGDDYKEFKFWMNYTFDAGSFTITPQIENHFDANSDLFDFDDATTTHVFQASVGFAGKGDVAPDLLVGYAFWGNEGLEPTLYIEAGVSFGVGDVALRPFFSTQYSEEGGFVDLGYEGDFVMNQLGIRASRHLRISDSISVPMGVLVAINPKTERAFTAFSISF
ncbi:MAG: hypothetical protein LAT84_13485 [Balneolia bacterium]|nr:hypothetical protein [Balneolia bacterium]